MIFIIIAVVVFVIFLAVIAQYFNDKNERQKMNDGSEMPNNKSINEMTYQEIQKLQEMQIKKLAEARLKEINQGNGNTKSKDKAIKKKYDLKNKKTRNDDLEA